MTKPSKMRRIPKSLCGNKRPGGFVEIVNPDPPGYLFIREKNGKVTAKRT